MRVSLSLCAPLACSALIYGSVFLLKQWLHVRQDIVKLFHVFQDIHNNIAFLIIPIIDILMWCHEHALTKESVRGGVSVFMFRLLLPRLLGLLANVDGQPRAHHPVNSGHRGNNQPFICDT